MTTKMHSRMYGWKYVWLEFADEFEATVDDPNPDSSHTEMSMVVPLTDNSTSLIYTMHPAKQGGHHCTTVETSYTGIGDFKFAIHPEKWTDGFGKLLGMQDIVVGHPEFDKAFIIKGSDEQRIKQLFQDSAVRQFLMDEPTMQFWAHCENADSAPTSRALRGEQNRLSMRVQGAVDDFERLKAFYNLKRRVLQALVKIGAASN